MVLIKVGFPSEGTDGVQDVLSPHFGHARTFTIVTCDTVTKAVAGVEVIKNDGHEQGGSMVSVTLLRDHGVNAVVLGAIGMRPLWELQGLLISTYRGVEGSIKLNLDAFLAGKLERLAGPSCS